ncbi:hypothetical protein B0I72DRAFT_142951 [Yarrowia lipolytica]|uniref:Uncharacterized protein n=1 Tax=Yarrowia lipolytica TaxID=4952 RepID=A0A371C3Z7_YARLL|nr:hypothetical protein B0I71DRAFT_133820 [Yarrowia lipolytica]RDW29570.1 hypothetical protein B0I72DRAFT_142951 [Yarrowia lipolytica]
MNKITVRRKRFLWHPDDIDAYYSDDYFSDDNERRHKLFKPRPTPMASLMNLELGEYELLRFYKNDSSPLLVAATGKNKEAQGFWMENVTKLATSNEALKEACMVFAMMHLGHNHKHATYLLKDGEEVPKEKLPPTDLSHVIGYTRLDEAMLEQMFIRFTNTIKAHKQQIMTMTLETSESVLLSSVLIYLIAMSMGPYVPLFNFDGGADLFSLGRTISDLTFLFSNAPPPTPFYLNNDFDLNDEREKLPREEDLWEIIDFVNTDEELSSTEKKRIQRILTTELKNLVGLFHMDAAGMSVSHIAGWCTFWTPDFYKLLREEMSTYALLFVCYWCGYAHMWHVLFWWGDRIQEDLLHLMDHLPSRVHHFLKWPLESCSRFDINYFDLLSGKMRDLYL